MKFKIMVGTISIIVMLSTPTFGQPNVDSDKSLILLMNQPEIVGLREGVKSPDVIEPATVKIDRQADEDLILQAQIKALDIDTIGLTYDEIRKQLKTAGQAKQRATLQARAIALKIDIGGLTNDQARLKIKAVERTNTLTNILAQAKTLGIGIDIIPPKSNEQTRLCLL
ncbi:MAG: hypothetical protein ACYDGZ_10165 [Desulfosporosinus fructosivorans]